MEGIVTRIVVDGFDFQLGSSRKVDGFDGSVDELPVEIPIFEVNEDTLFSGGEGCSDLHFFAEQVHVRHDVVEAKVDFLAPDLGG